MHTPACRRGKSYRKANPTISYRILYPLFNGSLNRGGRRNKKHDIHKMPSRKARYLVDSGWQPLSDSSLGLPNLGKLTSPFPPLPRSFVFKCQGTYRAKLKTPDVTKERAYGLRLNAYGARGNKRVDAHACLGLDLTFRKARMQETCTQAFRV